MASVINTNIASLNAQNNLMGSGSALQTALQRLSSGLRINSAKDDAAGLAISQRMTAQIRGLTQAGRNANDGVSLAQTGESALSTAGDMLQRIRELAVQSANATNSVSDRQALQAEAGQLTAELDRIATSTQFNGQNLLDGSFTSSVYQVGANANQTITATSANFRTAQYGNYRIGSVAATSSNGVGDLTVGSTANATISKTGAAGVNHIAGGAITINGSAGSSGAITILAGSTAQTAAAQINATTDKSGVTATARTEFDLTALAVSTNYSLNVTSNNGSPVTLTFQTGVINNSDGLSGAVKAFNDVSANTGVTAKINTAGNGITLTNDSGNNVTLANNVGSGTLTVAGVATAAAASAIVTGSITLDSEKSFGVVAANATDFFTATAASSQVQTVNNIDISSVAGATRALSQIDSALATVNGQRANYGALQSRFSSAITNLASITTNLSAARSRIMDTDFAAETANLTRAQILQQAGTAMLAQANTVPNQVLTLLR